MTEAAFELVNFGRIRGMKLALATALGAALLLPTGDPTQVDFATLSGFDYVEGMELPTEVTQFDEEIVEISGFMKREDGVSARSDEVEYFMLVNDACGCEGTPKLNEIIFCAMAEGETTRILPGIVKVTGQMYVGEEVDDGVVLALYTMDVDSLGENVSVR